VRQPPGFVRTVTPVKGGSPGRVRWAQPSPPMQARQLAACGTPAAQAPRWLASSTNPPTMATSSTDALSGTVQHASVLAPCSSSGVPATSSTDAGLAPRREEVLRAQLEQARRQLANTAGEVARLEAELQTASRENAVRDRSIAEAAAHLQAGRPAQQSGSLCLGVRSSSPPAAAVTPSKAPPGGGSGQLPVADSPQKCRLASSASTPVLSLVRSGSATQLLPPETRSRGIVQYDLPVMRGSIPSMGRLFAESDLAVDFGVNSKEARAASSVAAATGSRDMVANKSETGSGQMEQLADKVADEILGMAFQDVPAVHQSKMWTLKSRLASVILAVTRDRARMQARGQHQQQSPERRPEQSWQNERAVSEALNFDALWSGFERTVRQTCEECNMESTIPLLLSTVRMALTLQSKTGEPEGGLEAAVASLASRGVAAPCVPSPSEATIVPSAAGPTLIPKVKLPGHQETIFTNGKNGLQRSMLQGADFPRIQGFGNMQTAGQALKASTLDDAWAHSAEAAVYSGGSSGSSSASELSPLAQVSPEAKHRYSHDQASADIAANGALNSYAKVVAPMDGTEELSRFTPVEAPIIAADIGGIDPGVETPVNHNRDGSRDAMTYVMQHSNYVSSELTPPNKRSPAPQGEPNFACETRASRGKAALALSRDRSRRQIEVSRPPEQPQVVAVRAGRSPNGRSPNGRSSRWR